jgi:hypothetical protein
VTCHAFTANLPEGARQSRSCRSIKSADLIVCVGGILTISNATDLGASGGEEGALRTQKKFIAISPVSGSGHAIDLLLRVGCKTALWNQWRV